jgi:hypothetical protein
MTTDQPNPDGIAPPPAEIPDPGAFIRPAEAEALTAITSPSPTEALILDVATDRDGLYGTEMVVYLGIRGIGRRRMSLRQTPRRLEMAQKWRAVLATAPAVGPYRITSSTFMDRASGEVRTAWNLTPCEMVDGTTLADYTAEVPEAV